jgi:adenylate cyclase class 2
MEDILKSLGYSKKVQVKKKRLIGELRGYTICLDKVDGLGSFVEVEKMSADDTEKVQEELMKFLESLGISREQRIRKGYDTLMWEALKPNK